MAIRLSESCACGASTTIEDVSLPVARKLRDEFRVTHEHHLIEPLREPRRPTFGEAVGGALASTLTARRDIAQGGKLATRLITDIDASRGSISLDHQPGLTGGIVEQVPGQLDLIGDDNAGAAADALDDEGGLDDLVPTEPGRDGNMMHCATCGHEVADHGNAGCHAVNLSTGQVCECRETPDTLAGDPVSA